MLVHAHIKMGFGLYYRNKSDKFSLPRIYIGQKTSKNLLRLKLSKIYFVLNKLKKNIQLNN